MKSTKKSESINGDGVEEFIYGKNGELIPRSTFGWIHPQTKIIKMKTETINHQVECPIKRTYCHYQSLISNDGLANNKKLVQICQEFFALDDPKPLVILGKAVSGRSTTWSTIATDLGIIDSVHHLHLFESFDSTCEKNENGQSFDEWLTSNLGNDSTHQYIIIEMEPGEFLKFSSNNDFDNYQAVNKFYKSNVFEIVHYLEDGDEWVDWAEKSGKYYQEVICFLRKDPSMCEIISGVNNIPFTLNLGLQSLLLHQEKDTSWMRTTRYTPNSQEWVNSNINTLKLYLSLYIGETSEQQRLIQLIQEAWIDFIRDSKYGYLLMEQH